MEGTGHRAMRSLAPETTSGFGARHFLGQGKGDLVPVLDALAGVLLGKRLRGEFEPFFVV
jgi:hypothetical protein